MAGPKMLLSDPAYYQFMSVFGQITSLPTLYLEAQVIC